jgi:hypothetical protein
MLGLIAQNLSRSDATAALLGLMVLLSAGIWLLLRWIVAGPTSPEPWNEEVAAELLREDCPQICHRCFTPHEPSSHFCSHCGAMVGAHTCLIPPLYLYSIGDVFRAGAEGAYRRSACSTLTCFFAAFTYLYWVPFPLGCVAVIVYWKNVFKNVPAKRSLAEDEGPSTPNSQ